MNNNYFPWQLSQWEVLQQRKSQSTLPHALVLTGVEGVGKLEFALQFGKSLLCTNPNEQGLACGVCKNCKLLEAKSHPDWIEVVPEEAGKAIKIDQIRQLIQDINKTPQQGGYKIVILNPADSMNVNAANALLKTLEEPSKDTLIILITEHLMSLTPTVRSRCQIISFPVPDKKIALNWLQKNSQFYESEEQKTLSCSEEEYALLLSLAQGAPLKVLSLLANDALAIRKTLFENWLDVMRGKKLVIDLAQEWYKINFDQLYMHWNSWLMDILKLQSIAEDHYLVNVDFKDTLTKMARVSNMKKLHLFVDELNKIHQWKKRHINLNEQLMIEDLLIKNRDVLILKR